MHGVPADLDLSIFRGATLTQLAIGEFQVQFRFDPEGIISVEGKWELRSASGEVVDAAAETASRDANAVRDAYRLHVILGKAIESSVIDAPHSFSLRFTTGHVLTVFDDSTH